MTGEHVEKSLIKYLQSKCFYIRWSLSCVTKKCLEKLYNVFFDEFIEKNRIIKGILTNLS
jgi:hypothetical protein